jgi:hypothetical protein
MSIGAKWPTKAEATKAGWFSRRHQTSEAHEVEVARKAARLADEFAARDEDDRRHLAKLVKRTPATLTPAVAAQRAALMRKFTAKKVAS